MRSKRVREWASSSLGYPREERSERELDEKPNRKGGGLITSLELSRKRGFFRWDSLWEGFWPHRVWRFSWNCSRKEGGLLRSFSFNFGFGSEKSNGKKLVWESLKGWKSPFMARSASWKPFWKGLWSVCSPVSIKTSRVGSGKLRETGRVVGAIKIA